MDGWMDETAYYIFLNGIGGQSLEESCTYIHTYVPYLLVYCMELGEERTRLDSMFACFFFLLFLLFLSLL